jgi:hypothetical protein
MMTRHLLLAATLTTAVLALAVRPGQSYDATAASGRPAALLAPALAVQPAAGPATASKRKSVRRLPSYYGQVGLSDVQREAIYRLQEAYAEQLDALEKQLETLKNRRDQEIENVLSPAQKQRLRQLLEAAARRRAARSTTTAAKPVADDKQP